MSSSSESKSISAESRAKLTGGTRLRALREQAGRTQLWVELEAELGAGYLQRVESGKIALPERVTVERILDALQAGYGERREILQLFGYVATTRLPADDDLAWARTASQRELAAVDVPAYVLDCAHRLVAWNGAFPRLLGVKADDPVLARLAGRSLLAPWFDPASPLGRLVAEPDAFLPALIRAMRHEMRPFAVERWYEEVLADLMTLPRFRHYRAAVEQEAAPVGGGRALVPVRLAVPGAGLLCFRLAAEPFTRDPRFRVVYYFPADTVTLLACAAWAEGAPRAEG
jgi:transcriptional regulator with XRE-family HTH domain